MNHLHAPILPPAHKRGDQVVISGHKYHYLGSGRFTSAYLNASGKSVILYTYFNDPSKDVVIRARELASKRVMRHLPWLKFDGDMGTARGRVDALRGQGHDNREGHSSSP
jgi:hypothetical protein